MNTIVILKPDAVDRGLFRDFCDMLYDDCVIPHSVYIEKYKKINPLGSNNKRIRFLLQEHYQEHKSKSFYNDLVDYMCSGEFIVILVKSKIEYSEKHITDIRNFATKFRNKYALNQRMNSIHSSDSVLSADREEHIWFELGKYL